MSRLRWSLFAALAAVLLITVTAFADSGAAKSGGGSGAGSGSDSGGGHGGKTQTTSSNGGGPGGNGGGSGGQSGRPARGIATYTFPAGDVVFPEGIAIDRHSGDFFVSSAATGAIYKGNTAAPAITPFVASADGRTGATGMKIDNSGNIFVSGAGTGKAFVLSEKDGSTEKVLDSGAGTSPTFINDVALAPGFAYFTDSSRPVVLRVSRDGDTIGDLQPWLDLTGTPFVYQPGFNANGIVSADDGKLLLIVQSNTGKLFRINTVTKKVTEVDLHGATLPQGDGLVLDGSRLYVSENSGEIDIVKLRRGKTDGTVSTLFKGSPLLFPTTMAKDDHRLLTVNGQLDKLPPSTVAPVLPFTVVAITANHGGGH